MRVLTFKVGQHLLRLGPGLHRHILFRSLELALVSAGLLVWTGDHNLWLCRSLHLDWQMWMGEICSTHINLFVSQHARPGHDPDLTHLLVIHCLVLAPHSSEGTPLEPFWSAQVLKGSWLFFPVIRSSMLGTEPVFLHLNDIFLIFLEKKANTCQIQEMVTKALFVSCQVQRTQFLPFWRQARMTTATERAEAWKPALRLGPCPVSSLLLY